MDPLASKALIDTMIPRPDVDARRPARSQPDPRRRRRLAATLRRWADHLEAPEPAPAPCA